MITPTQIAWIAGLLEGEGTFCFMNSNLGAGASIRIGISMADRDVIEKFANCLGFGSISVAKMQKYGVATKPQYRWECSSSRAAGLMMTVYSLLGERRQARIRELLNHWKSTHPKNLKVRERKVFSFPSR